MWRRFDEDLIGPEAMLRLLTVAGSTSYTRHCWGQGRWPAICREVISDATEAAIALLAPYDAKGAEALLRDLIEPDTLSDDVLAWMIDIPGTGGNGPWGLRGHESTRPVTRTVHGTPRISASTTPATSADLAVTRLGVSPLRAAAAASVPGREASRRASHPR